MHRYGKKPRDREYHIANSLKKKCKKKYYLGIHDRLIRDEKFRKNMIDNVRTEKICRQMDDLAVENHTHHLIPQEIEDIKRNWSLRSNKTCSETLPVQRISDFKEHSQPCSDWNKKKKAFYKRPRTLTEINNGHKALFRDWIGKIHGWLFLFMKVTMEMNQVLKERCGLLNNIWINFSGQDFLKFNYIVTNGSFTADGGLL